MTNFNFKKEITTNENGHALPSELAHNEDLEECPFCYGFFPLGKSVCPNIKCSCFRVSVDDYNIPLIEREDLVEEIAMKKISKKLLMKEVD